MHEWRGAPQPDLPELLRRLSPVDFVVVEGFKTGAHPKIEVFRAAVGKPLLQPGDPAIVGIVTDGALEVPVPVLGFAEIEAIATFVERHAE